MFTCGLVELKRRSTTERYRKEIEILKRPREYLIILITAQQEQSVCEAPLVVGVSVSVCVCVCVSQIAAVSIYPREHQDPSRLCLHVT